MKNKLLKAFFNCGDSSIIEFAVYKAHLNRLEKEVISLIFDECYTQEEVAEHLDLSTRKVQMIYYKAQEKLLNIPWLFSYAYDLVEGEINEL